MEGCVEPAVRLGAMVSCGVYEPCRRALLARGLLGHPWLHCTSGWPVRRPLRSALSTWSTISRMLSSVSPPPVASAARRLPCFAAQAAPCRPLQHLRHAITAASLSTPKAPQLERPIAPERAAPLRPGQSGRRAATSLTAGRRTSAAGTRQQGASKARPREVVPRVRTGRCYSRSTLGCRGLSEQVPRLGPKRAASRAHFTPPLEHAVLHPALRLR